MNKDPHIDYAVFEKTVARPNNDLEYQVRIRLARLALEHDRLAQIGATKIPAPHTQSRLSSLIESLFNILIGYGIAVASQLAVFPLFDIHIPLSSNLWIGAWFTFISLIRSYSIRRWFNAKLHKAALALTREST